MLVRGWLRVSVSSLHEVQRGRDSVAVGLIMRLLLIVNNYSWHFRQFSTFKLHLVNIRVLNQSERIILTTLAFYKYSGTLFSFLISSLCSSVLVAAVLLHYTFFGTFMARS